MKVEHPKQKKRGGGKKTALATAISSALSMTASGGAYAQEGVLEEVVITGIRGSLTRAMDIKRDASGVVDSISAEDIGKFPDLNVAESLQRISGVSIDRSGGEGQAITVRGLGPQFNTVLVNGRQLATDSNGREFNFDLLSADLISGADIYKSTQAHLQEGAIGATVNVSTARPFDNPGLQLVGSIKGMHESLSEGTSPSGSILVSQTFGDDDSFGILFAASHQEREVQINQIGTAGWRSGQTIANKNDGILFTNAFIPRNWDQTVDEQERTRDNASLVLQWAPSDNLSIILDGFVSKFEVDSLVTDLASWFEPDRVGSGTIDPVTGTLLDFTQEIDIQVSSGDPASDFVSHTRNSRDSTNDGLGINVEWAINEKLVGTFDVSTSSAENDRAGRDRFNVIGIINNYSFSGGSSPVVAHDGFENGALPDANRARLHYNEKGNQFTDEDQIGELKADFEYIPDTEVFQSFKFGFYSQEREKEAFQIHGSQCEFCGYATPAPLDTVGFRSFEAKNFFSGLIDTFYTYDGDAYVQYLADSGNPIEPVLQNNRYKIEEDITSLYVDFTFGFDIGDMPVEINMGARYAETDIEVEAIQSFIADVIPTTDLTLFENVLGPATVISQGDSYSNILPSLNIKLEIQEDMVLRFAAYDSLTRPTMSELSPATTFNEPRRQNLTASGGNPGLEPFASENWDLSFEWYYGESSVFSVAVFDKEIENFITSLTGDETFTLFNRSAEDDFRCSSADCAEGLILNDTTPDVDVVGTTDELNGAQEVYSVSRPRNGETANVTGYEVAITHVFENGFGIVANATVVDSNASLGTDAADSFGLEGLGDSQNLIVFYETERWQARVAFNNRDGFLRRIDNQFNGEPINTDTFGQWDISASYDINDNFTVFFEGINITEEELVQTGRFKNQIYNIEDNGSRYAIGIRGRF